MAKELLHKHEMLIFPKYCYPFGNLNVDTRPMQYTFCCRTQGISETSS